MKYHIESKFSNLDYRLTLLRQEFQEMLLELLPPDGTAVELSYEDELGDVITSLSNEWVTSATNEYPFREMSIHDMKEAISALINGME